MGRTLRRTGKKEYAVEENGRTVAWLYAERRPGQCRQLRKYVGCWDAYIEWVLDPGGDKPFRFFDTFKKAKAAAIAAKGE